VDHQLIAEARVAVPKKRATRSRAALMEALLVLLQQKPFDKVTVREITDQASVGYATFFRHFTDKDELLHDMAAGEISKLLTMTLPMLYTVETRPSTQALCAYVWSNRAIWSTLLTGGAAGVLKDEFNRQAQEVAIRHPKTDSGLPGDLAVVFSVAATVEIIAWWLRHPQPPSISEMAAIIDRLVVLPSLMSA
jgi:AcrR family transcriptional regulator